MNESFRRECCERCGEWNDSADVQIVEHSDGSGEVVCKPCLDDQYNTETDFSEYDPGELKEQEDFAGDNLFDCYSDEI